MTIQNFAQLNEYLKQFIPGSIQNGDFYNPKKMYELLPLVGSPQEKFKVIHVAGTSGKTSTCYYLSQMLSLSGAKVGLSVSPHIFEVNERVQVNNQPLNEERMCELFNDFITTPGLVDLKPTYFEMLVTFAFWAFAQEGCEYAVVEVGLGGLKDATNVIENPNKVVVITDIGLDHTKILGETIEKIAAQKAGIIKTGNNVFCYEQNEVVNKVIDQNVVNADAKLHRFEQPNLAKNTTFLKWLPEYQKRNWLLARSVIEFVAERDKLHIPPEELQATQETEIPARMQKLKIGNKLVILDGAHNPQKLGALTQSLQTLYPNKSFVLLTGFVESKQATLKQSLQKLHEIADDVIVTEFHTNSDLPHQAINADKLAQEFAQEKFRNVQVITDNEQAFQTLLNREHDVLVVTGSFYLIACLYPLMRKYLHA